MRALWRGAAMGSSALAMAAALEHGRAMRRNGTGPRLTLLIALMLAVGVRFMCPPGWMPNPTGMGAPFILCPAEGEMPGMAPAIPMHMHMHGDDPPVHDKTHQDHCVPGAWVLGTATEAPVISAPVAFEIAPLQSIALPRAATPPARHRPQAPRAPPFLA